MSKTWRKPKEIDLVLKHVPKKKGRCECGRFKVAGICPNCDIQEENHVRPESEERLELDS